VDAGAGVAAGVGGLEVGVAAGAGADAGVGARSPICGLAHRLQSIHDTEDYCHIV